MGNCQAAEAATVVIQHPEGKVERAYWSLSASQVMAANPGHYVAAVIVTSSSASSYNNDRNAVNGDRNSGRKGASHPVKHLKLLRPDDTLHIGHVYRLVSFEQVLREFASKKHVKLSRLLAKQADQKPTRPRRRTSSGGGVGYSTYGGGRIATTSPVSEEKPKQQQQQQEEEQKEGVEEEEASKRVEAELEEAMQRLMAVGGSSGRSSSSSSSRAPYRNHAQWRPALQSIAEAGTTTT